MRVRVWAPFVALLALSAGCAPERQRSELLLATTTSVRDSGLLDALLPAFTKETKIHVRVVAVGTGAALRMGAEGNADVLLTHAPSAELELVESGAVLGRRPFMENHFVIAGPPEDPAGVAAAGSAADALRRIRDARAPYVSRGDDSGTHKREVELLTLAGLDPGGGWPGFASTGAGMGLTLQVAGTRRAYVLSDIGTFLAFRERIGLRALSTPEPALRNEYAVLRVNGERFGERIRMAEAESFEAYLARDDVQERISEFGKVRFGRSLFRPLLIERAVASGG